MSANKEYQPENPALFKILLIKIKGTTRTHIIINNMMINSAGPIPTITLPFTGGFLRWPIAVCQYDQYNQRSH